MNGLNTTIIQNYTTGSSGIIGVINTYLVPLVFTISFIVFLYGVARAYIISGASEAERAKGHQLILWGVVGFAVMLSVWGLVNLFQSIVGVKGGGTSPALPQIQTTTGYYQVAPTQGQ